MKAIRIYIVLSIIMLNTACESFLETEPRQSISNEVALEDLAGLEAALVGLYDDFQATALYGRNNIVIPELLSDNIRIAQQNSNRLVNHSFNAEFSHADNWDANYNAINKANNLIAFADDASGTTANDVARIKGTAFFFRGLAYHDLVKAYGRNPNHLIDNFDLGVPLVLQPFQGLDDSAFPSRNTVFEVYDQIESDLLEAINLLTDDGFPHFATDLAAKALLARVYLFEGRWADAAAMANEVINESPVGLETGDDYIEIFRNSSESLFELFYSDVETNAATVYYVKTPEGAGNGDGVLRDDMIEQYDANDKRAALLIDAIQGPETVTFNLKFNSYNGTQFVDNIALLRISEMYLIRAEANFENNSSTGASPLDDINTLRTRAGLPDLTNLTLDDIMTERRIELAFEGHRFWDLKRRGMDIPKGKEGTIDCGDECVIPYTDHRVVDSLFQGELDTNKNLVNNPGYSTN
ncbi:MAG: RagB/SusD family nutrient uptake outer membrane protein [Bacteroidota bacterium]